MLFVALTVYGGRWVRAGNDVRSAAHAGARAATLESDPASARQAAVDMVATNLDASGVACTGGPAVDVDLSNFGPNGQVSVTVTCTADLADVAVLGVPGTATFSGSATEVIDRYIEG